MGGDGGQVIDRATMVKTKGWGLTKGSGDRYANSLGEMNSYMQMVFEDRGLGNLERHRLRMSTCMISQEALREPVVAPAQGTGYAWAIIGLKLPIFIVLFVQFSTWRYPLRVLTRPDATCEAAKVRGIAEAYPGVLAHQALSQMRSNLMQSLGEEDRGNSMQAVAVQYYRQVLQKKATGAVARELLSLCAAVDHLVRARPTQALDLLLQRLKSPESTLGGTHWSVSQKLELLLPEQATLTATAEMKEAQRIALEESKTRRLRGRMQILLCFLLLRCSGAVEAETSARHGEAGMSLVRRHRRMWGHGESMAHVLSADGVWKSLASYFDDATTTTTPDPAGETTTTASTIATTEGAGGAGDATTTTEATSTTSTETSTTTSASATTTTTISSESTTTSTTVEGGCAANQFFWEEKKRCEDCNANCTSCFGFGMHRCNGCKHPYFLDGTLCRPNCGWQKFKNETANTCDPCDSSCKLCSGSAKAL
eukprot:s529_g1.t1